MPKQHDMLSFNRALILQTNQTERINIQTIVCSDAMKSVQPVTGVAQPRVEGRHVRRELYLLSPPGALSNLPGTLGVLVGVERLDSEHDGVLKLRKANLDDEESLSAVLELDIQGKLYYRWFYTRYPALRPICRDRAAELTDPDGIFHAVFLSSNTSFYPTMRTGGEPVTLKLSRAQRKRCSLVDLSEYLLGSADERFATTSFLVWHQHRFSRTTLEETVQYVETELRNNGRNVAFHLSLDKHGQREYFRKALAPIAEYDIPLIAEQSCENLHLGIAVEER